MGSLRDSHICRICGKANENVHELFENSEDLLSFNLSVPKLNEKGRKICFYLPLDISLNSPLPRVICNPCDENFETLVNFFISLNEGQFLLSEIFSSTTLSNSKNESQVFTIPDLLQEKKCLFRFKYPSLPRTMKKENPTLSSSSSSSSPSPSSSLYLEGNRDDPQQISSPSKSKRGPGRPRKEDTITTKEKRDPSFVSVNEGGNNETGPGRRNRRPPKRFEESLQGKDLDSMFMKDEFKEESSYSKDQSLIIRPDDGNIDKEDVDPSVDNNIPSQFKIIEGIHDQTVVLELPENSSLIRELSSNNETITLNVDRNTDFEELGVMLSQLNQELEVSNNNQRSQDITDPDNNLSSFSSSTAIHKQPFRQPYVRSKNRCDICEKSFKHVGRLALHKSQAHVGVYFECSVSDCKKKFKTRNAIELHLKSVNHSGMSIIQPEPDKSKFSCSKCNKSFATKQTLENHINSFHKKNQKQYFCSSCDKYLVNLGEYKDHLSSFHPDHGSKGNFVCDLCESKFDHPLSLEYHKESNHQRPVTNYTCKECGKVFKQKLLLQRHLAVHDNIRPYACDQCDSKFKSRNNLKAHQTIHTGEKNFFCHTCGKQFSYKTSLIQHTKLHEGDRPYKCQFCPKSFAQNGNLQEHTRIHTGEKPYKCSICDRKFTTSSQHKLHEKRHRGERPWKCEFCNKDFLHKDTWKSHIRRHKGDKPFVCNFCEKGFSEPWALNKHKRLHTGEKPYTCRLCSKSFSDCSNLAKHKKIHEKENKSQSKNNYVYSMIRDSIGRSNENSDSLDDNEDVQQVIYITYDQFERNEAGGATATDPTTTLNLTQLAEAVAEATNNDPQSESIHIDDSEALQIISDQVTPTTSSSASTGDVLIHNKDGTDKIIKVPLVLASEYLHSLPDNIIN